jgi:hypothetical protein
MDWISKVSKFSQQSLGNTLGTIKEVHQILVEVPIDIAEELGAPPDKCAEVKAQHRRILDHVEKGVASSCNEVLDYIVKQAELVDELAAGREEPKPLARLERPPAMLKKLG